MSQASQKVHKKKRSSIRISLMVITAMLSTQTLGSVQSIAYAAQTKAPVLPTRTEAPAKYKWDLSEIYKDRKSFEADLTKVKTELLPQLAAFKGQLSNPQKFKTFMTIDEQVSRIVLKAYVYSTFYADLDQSQSAGTELLDMAQGLYGDYSEAVSFVTTEFSKMSAESFNALASDPSLTEYKRYFDKLSLTKSHTLSDPEELLLAQLTEINGAPDQMFSKITVADYKDPVIKDSKGKTIVLTDAKYDEIMKSGDRALRKAAYEATMASYAGQINALSTNYATQVKLDVFNAKVRKYNSALEASLNSEEIPKAIYDNLVKAVNNNLTYLHKYNEVKKNYFGFSQMYSYDTRLPIAGSVNYQLSYDDAVKMINKGLAPLGTQYLKDFNLGINNKWVDVYSDENKASGGYQWGSYDTHPYILMNYDNSLDEALTLAHEMGHAMNTLYSNQNQKYINADYPIFTAEVASTVNELLVMDYLIKNAKTDDEKLFLINKQIENIKGTIYSQVMYAEFEQKIHAIAEADQPLSADVMNKTWLTLVQKYNGKALTVPEAGKYSWSRISHFYSAFYVYKYATSMSAAYSIVNQINGAESKTATENYLKFLGSGGTLTPVESLKLAGVDMNSTEPVDSVLKYFGTLVDEYEKILKAKKAAGKKAS